MEFRRVLFRSLRSYDRAEMRAPESGRRRGPAATGASVDQKARRCPWLCYDAAMTVPQPAMRKRLATMLMKAVNLALPPRCLGCGLIVDRKSTRLNSSH